MYMYTTNNKLVRDAHSSSVIMLTKHTRNKQVKEINIKCTGRNQYFVFVERRMNDDDDFIISIAFFVFAAVSIIPSNYRAISERQITQLISFSLLIKSECL